VKFDVQNSHGKFVPVVDGTVNGPLKMSCGGEREVDMLVLVTTCSWLVANWLRLKPGSPIRTERHKATAKKRSLRRNYLTGIFYLMKVKWFPIRFGKRFIDP